jgi:D-alanyl-lipoteichoic acid acyltransferase DltB (MBOAT superfamily)
MLFTSFTFVLFLIVLFILYWFIFNRNLKIQNLLLLIAGYVFYGWWDWRFLILLFFISASNYAIGLLIQSNDKQRIRKLYFLSGLIINIGTLVIFKYFNFFIEGFVNLVSLIGFRISPVSLSLLMPLGISFYIFLSLSYLIDVYRQNLKAERNFPEVLLTLSFFPIILAGPIQRPIKLLPQIQNARIFSYEKATDGLKQILWGIFMKSVIADNCGNYSDIIFKDYLQYSGSTLIAGAFLFTVQIYADFAGYSNIAIGTGKLFGFNIMKNFAFPYFSRDIGEFWKRWNISLTTWFRDYIFLPIAFSLTRKIKPVRVLIFKKELLIYTIGILITWLLTGSARS